MKAHGVVLVPHTRDGKPATREDVYESFGALTWAEVDFIERFPNDTRRKSYLTTIYGRWAGPYAWTEYKRMLRFRNRLAVQRAAQKSSCTAA